MVWRSAAQDPGQHNRYTGAVPANRQRPFHMGAGCSCGSVGEVLSGRGTGNADSGMVHDAQGTGLAYCEPNERASLAGRGERILLHSSQAGGSAEDIQRRPPGNHGAGPAVQLLSPVSGHDPTCYLSRRPDCVAEEGGFGVADSAMSEKSPPFHGGLFIQIVSKMLLGLDGPTEVR